jgi:glutamate N-acetyltransferase/amino-acid N-acetyltransferase
MASGDLLLEITLDRGDAAALVWTTDLSYDYVRINAEYRT